MEFFPRDISRPIKALLTLLKERGYRSLALCPLQVWDPTRTVFRGWTSDLLIKSANLPRTWWLCMIWNVAGQRGPLTQHGHRLLSLVPQCCIVDPCLGGPEASAVSGQRLWLPASALTRDSHSGSSGNSLTLRLFLLEG